MLTETDRSIVHYILDICSLLWENKEHYSGTFPHPYMIFIPYIYREAWMLFSCLVCKCEAGWVCECVWKEAGQTVISLPCCVLWPDSLQQILAHASIETHTHTVRHTLFACVSNRRLLFDWGTRCLYLLTRLIWDNEPPSPLGSHTFLSSPLIGPWLREIRQRRKTRDTRETQRRQSSPSDSETQAWLNACTISIISPLRRRKSFIDFCRFTFAYKAAWHTKCHTSEETNRDVWGGGGGGGVDLDLT